MTNGPNKAALDAVVDELKAKYAIGFVLQAGAWPESEKKQFLEDWRKLKNHMPVALVPEGLRSAEQTISDVMDMLGKDKVGRGAAEQIKGAAEQSIRRQTRDGGLTDAIRPR